VFHRFLVGFKSRPKAHLGVAVVAIANQLSFVALAAGPSVAAGDLHAQRPLAAFCSQAVNLPGCAAGGDSLQVSLPDGSQSCPGSDVVAACAAGDGSAKTAPGVASTPDGLTACVAAGGAPIPSGPAACSDTLLPPIDPGAGQANSAPVVNPSVPVASLQAATAPARIELTSSVPIAQPGNNVVLTATASASVSGSNKVIEIFDQTTGTLLGSCAQGGQCAVAYNAKSGNHSFVAYIDEASTKVPAGNRTIKSNVLAVNWVGVTLATKDAIVGPGRTATITATTTSAIDKTGYQLQLFDSDSKARLTFCSQGTSCSTSLTQPVGGVRTVVAVLAKQSSTLPAQTTLAQSDPLSLTWLSVTIQGDGAGSGVHLTATANADLTKTPWSIGIFDEQGHLVGPVCKGGSTCSAQVTVTGDMPKFSAAIGAVAAVDTSTKLGQFISKIASPAEFINVQARSSAVKPKRMLWGVDSCKSFTSDGLYPQIVSGLGAPDFWGRYLTDAVCPPLSSSEVAAAHTNHMGILPIYNERDCSNVSGYDTGKAYAAEAIAAAHAIGLPQGKGIAIDIEPAGAACPGAANLDTGLIHGWYDGIMSAGYAPIYYGSGVAGSEFAAQWCYTVADLPYIGERSYLWSFQPSLLGGYMKSNAPGFSPAVPSGCTAFVHGWQYQIGSSSWAAPDVDQDEATSDMPIWFP
jgi:hypothetical protein